MPNAKQYVDLSKSTLMNTTSSLQQALNSAEKAENKQTIQSAIDSINTAYQHLSQYKD